MSFSRADPHATRRARVLALCMGLWLAAGAASAHAQGEARSASTLREAVDQVEAETGGRILSAETVTSGDSRVHRIKVLTPEGVVKVVQVVAGNAAESS